MRLFIAALATSLISLMVGALLLVGANFGIHPAFTVPGLIWLATVGLPTSVGVVLAASVWGRIDSLSGLPGFLVVASVLGCLLQSVAMVTLARSAAVARAKGRPWRTRRVLAATGVITVVMIVALLATRRIPPLPARVLDGHAHLFGDQGWPPVHKKTSGLSPVQKANPTYGLLTRLLQLPPGADLTEAYIQALVHQVVETQKVVPSFRVVLLAQDCRYTDEGEPDWAQSSVYVPNEQVFEVTRRYPGLFLPCPSINPQRKDWEAELKFCLAQGARVLKIHPPTQAVNPSNPRFRDFYRQCAKAGMNVMVHTGAEHSAPIADPTLGAPRLLALALEEGCTVIAAHAGTKSFFDPPVEDHLRELSGMMTKHPRLFADTAVLGSQFRWRCVPDILQDPVVANRVVHASDWPFPANAMVFWHRLHPVTVIRLMAEPNLFLRDLQLKHALGLPPESFDQMSRLIEEPRK